MAMKKIDKTRTTRTRSTAGSADGFSPIVAKRAALKTVERRARRKPAGAAAPRGRRATTDTARNTTSPRRRPATREVAKGSAKGTARLPAKRMAKTPAKAVRKGAAKKAAAKGAAKAPQKGAAASRPTMKTAAPAKKSANKRTSAGNMTGHASPKRMPSAKQISEKLWRLAQQKSARRASAPAWQQIEHHDGHAQVNAPPVRSARVPAGKRGDRLLTPAEKQRAGE